MPQQIYKALEYNCKTNDRLDKNRHMHIASVVSTSWYK